jgi:hypothetical protein
MVEDFFCGVDSSGENVCRMDPQGVLLYRDPNHLNTSGSIALVNHLAGEFNGLDGPMSTPPGESAASGNGS